MTADNILIENVLIIPLITGVVQALKMAWKSEKVNELAPVIAILLGIFFNAGLNGVSFQNIVIGFVYGLTSMGLYDGVKISRDKVQAFQESRKVSSVKAKKIKADKTLK